MNVWNGLIMQLLTTIMILLTCEYYPYIDLKRKGYELYERVGRRRWVGPCEIDSRSRRRLEVVTGLVKEQWEAIVGLDRGLFFACDICYAPLSAPGVATPPRLWMNCGAEGNLEFEDERTRNLANYAGNPGRPSTHRDQAHVNPVRRNGKPPHSLLYVPSTHNLSVHVIIIHPLLKPLLLDGGVQYGTPSQRS